MANATESLTCIRSTYSTFWTIKNYIASNHETYVVIGWNSESLKFLSIGGGGGLIAIRKAVREGGLINRGFIRVFPV